MIKISFFKSKVNFRKTNIINMKQNLLMQSGNQLINKLKSKNATRTFLKVEHGYLILVFIFDIFIDTFATLFKMGFSLYFWKQNILIIINLAMSFLFIFMILNTWITVKSDKIFSRNNVIIQVLFLSLVLSQSLGQFLNYLPKYWNLSAISFIFIISDSILPFLTLIILK